MKPDQIIAILNSKVVQYVVGTICILVVLNKGISLYKQLNPRVMPALDSAESGKNLA